MPSGVVRPGAPGSTTSRRCVLTKTAHSTPPIGATRTISGCMSTKCSSAAPAKRNCSHDFFEYGEGDGKSTWPFGVAVDEERDRVYCSDEWTNTISVFDTGGKFITQVGDDRQRRRRVAASGGLSGREERQCHRRRQRQQPAASLHSRRQVRRQVRQGRQRATANSTSPGASRSTRMATSTSPTGRTTASRSCPPRASS